MMREEDLLRFTWIADPQISPDGTRVAFTRVTVDEAEDAYRTSLWVADVDGDAPPRAVTYGQQDSTPRWSPDGRWLAFLRSPEPKKPGQLWVLPMAGGDSFALTALECGASDPAWSPDGTRLAFLSTTNPALDTPDRKKPKHEPARVVTRAEFRMNGEGFTDFDRREHVWVTALVGGTPRPLTTGRFAETAPRWSHDGGAILFLSDRREEPWFGPEDCTLYRVPADLESADDGERFEVIADIHGPIHAYVEDATGRVAVVGAEWPKSPNSYDQDQLLLFEGPLPRTTPRRLAADWDVEFGAGITSDQHPPRGGGAMPLGFTADGQAVLCVAQHTGAARIARVPIAGGTPAELTDAAHEVVAGSVTPDGRRMALVMGSVETPGDLCVLDVETGRLRRRFAPNDALLAETGVAPVEELWVESFDGAKIQAWLVKPPDFDPKKRWPMVLEIHGGPHTAYGVAYFHEFQVLASAGYLVLYTNPRGSTGYGQAFANCIQYKYPGDDYKDLMACVDAVVARGYVDEARLGVTGGSGGGLLTNWVVTQTHRFKAAITQRCVSDWIAFWYSCDFSMMTPSWFRKPPFEDPHEYLERSPTTYASKIETPLLVIHSEEDWRTPIGQGESMFRALLQQKKPTAMVRFPGESHELSRSGTPSRRVQNQRAIRRWFDRYLLGREVPELVG